MKYLSLFSGIGGFEIGIQNAIPTTKRKKQRRTTNHLPSNGQEQLGAQCVGYSEIDKYAIQIYQKHFPNHKNYGDITKIITSELPDFDLLVGGFPCQAFSIAGKRRGFDDTRGTLFFDVARILKEKRPRNFVLENVKGLLSHDNGRTFKVIISTLAELGYCVEWQVLNAKNFGVPQNRERVFIVGHLGGIPERKVFPIGENGEKSNAEVSLVSRGISVKQSTRAKSNTKGELLQDGQDRPIHQLNQPKHSNDRIYGTGGVSPTLNTAQGGNRQPFILEDGMQIRRLTPLECERLMGYPDKWTEGVSDTQRYKTLGNGIVSNVVEEVIKRLTSPL